MLRRICSQFFGCKRGLPQQRMGEAESAIEATADPVVLPLLLNRLLREGQITPLFIGEFNGVQSLPWTGLPAIYCWLDSSNAGGLTLSLNRPLLQAWAAEELAGHGLQVDESDPRIEATIANLMLTPIEN